MKQPCAHMILVAAVMAYFDGLRPCLAPLEACHVFRRLALRGIVIPELACVRRSATAAKGKLHGVAAVRRCGGGAADRKVYARQIVSGERKKSFTLNNELNLKQINRLSRLNTLFKRLYYIVHYEDTIISATAASTPRLCLGLRASQRYPRAARQCLRRRGPWPKPSTSCAPGWAVRPRALRIEKFQ